VGKYNSTVTASIQFDGDTVTAQLARLSFEDALAMQTNTPLQSSQLVLKYVLSLDGLRDASGNAITKETAFAQFYFAPLVAELTKAVLATGSVPDGGAGPFGEK
jgi:hypothetical protein